MPVNYLRAWLLQWLRILLGKTPVLDLTQRRALIQTVVKKYENVSVVAFHGLTITCAIEQGAQALLRGLRSSDDLAFEQQMAALNRHLAPAIDTIFLSTSPEYLHISASLVRQIAELKGDISTLVPEPVVTVLQQHYLK